MVILTAPSQREVGVEAEVTDLQGRPESGKII